MARVKSAPHNPLENNGPERGDGSVTRYAFTLAIATAICLSIIAFMYLLERRTEDAADRLAVDPKTSAQLYGDALSIEIPALRKTALQNFIAAYPESAQAYSARRELEDLIALEAEDFAAASDIFYSVTANYEDRKAALDAFEAQWGSATFTEEITAMRARLETEKPAEDTLSPITRPAGRLAGATANSQAEDPSVAANQALAGDVRPAVPAPILLPEAAPEPMDVIIPAKAKKDVTPRYPRRAQARGVEAVVIVAMDIDETGRVTDARIVQAATGRYANDFGKAALDAARNTAFTPKTVNGEPEPTNGFVQRYRFALSD